MKVDLERLEREQREKHEEARAEWLQAKANEEAAKDAVHEAELLYAVAVDETRAAWVKMKDSEWLVFRGKNGNESIQHMINEGYARRKRKDEKAKAKAK